MRGISSFVSKGATVLKKQNLSRFPFFFFFPVVRFGVSFEKKPSNPPWSDLR